MVGNHLGNPQGRIMSLQISWHVCLKVAQVIITRFGIEKTRHKTFRQFGGKWSIYILKTATS